MCSKKNHEARRGSNAIYTIRDRAKEAQIIIANNNSEKKRTVNKLPTGASAT